MLLFVLRGLNAKGCKANDREIIKKMMIELDFLGIMVMFCTEFYVGFLVS